MSVQLPEDTDEVREETDCRCCGRAKGRPWQLVCFECWMTFKREGHAVALGKPEADPERTSSVIFVVQDLDGPHRYTGHAERMAREMWDAILETGGTPIARSGGLRVDFGRPWR